MRIFFIFLSLDFIFVERTNVRMYLFMLNAYIFQNFCIEGELRRKYFIKNRDVHCKALNLRILQYYKMY